MNQSSNGYAPLEGSTRSVPKGNKVKASSLNEVIEVTVRLRRRAPIDDYVKKAGAGNKGLERTEYAGKFGADDADIEKIKAFAHQNNLTIANISIPRRSVFLKGTIQHFSAAFKVNLSDYTDAKGKLYRGRTGQIQIPAELQGIVIGVFGLDNREQARPMFTLVKDRVGNLLSPSDNTQVTYTPMQVAAAYNYPQDVTGSGQCIALIELGGGYRPEDMDTYFKTVNLATPSIIPISVDGALNDPTDANSADGEVALDIEVAGAVAPGAKIAVYFAPNTDQGFIDALTSAVHDEDNKPSVISISWASSEEYWSQQAYTNFEQTLQSAKALGITVLCAAGDHGSSNQETDGRAHVSYPASSYYVLACGGTNLNVNSEVVWNDENGWATGGGISEIVAVPDYQGNVTLPASVNPGAGAGRGVPDIAGNASAQSGYQTLIDGGWYVSSGTSAVAPLIGGLIALANQKLGRNVGFIHDKLYQAPSSAFKDIVDGNNNTADNGGYTAAVGWDACTGLGVPLGDIIQYL